jgi:hypothetical protein
LQLLSALIIQYPKIGNEPILKAFKNNFDRILVFWAYFENIMQHKKYVKSRRKKMGWYGYDLKIFIIISAHKKHPYIFFMHDSMSITIKLANIKK